ncbi:MAG: hypothetical protein FJ137_21910 [Deltaproteobacteria bacterium]|nr:hypothetical protein [Deltaproteobacteria bacterium]
MASARTTTMRRRLVVYLAAVVCLYTGACGPVSRDAACEKADACDQALEAPYGSFAVDDLQFGDTGSCWLTAETATPCVAACDRFVADRLAEHDADADGRAEVATDQAVVDACR